MVRGLPSSWLFPRRQWLLFGLAVRQLRNSLALLARRSRLRLVMIVFFSVIVWGSLYALTQEGFRFLRSFETHVPMSQGVIELLFGMFFLGLTGLMMFSMGLLLYGSLFASPEAGFLLSTPAQADQVFAYKFYEALFFCGWGLLLIGTPSLVAYGVTYSVSWYYYALFVPYLLGFMLLPGTIGALGCLVVVQLLPQRRKQALWGVATFVLLAFSAWSFPLLAGAMPDGASDQWIMQWLEKFKPVRLPYLPSQWLTRGLIASATEDGEGALVYLLLVWSNSLFLYVLGTWLAQRFYRRAYSRVASMGSARRSYGLHWSDRLASWLLRLTDTRTGLFILKDIRSFRRDPVQWAQVLIFGGILLLYFLNIPRLSAPEQGLQSRTVVGLLNLALLGLMLATYTCRFIFPMMSLEGRQFWILGLLPLERERLLQGKFIYAAAFTTSTSLVLTFLSGFMLDLPWPIIGLHLLAMLVLGLGLSSISVGLGATLVNFKETNPAKIATGFGGTINLLVSLAFSVAVVSLAALPTFMYFTNYELRNYDNVVFERLGWWLILSIIGLFFLGAVAVKLPLARGKVAFRNMEF